MGTHISRVKSVDLDSWTDEQMKSILSWGNARANKYWEAKLAQGHAPSESKIENFIRTKYEMKRWVMDGGIPDPATLDVDGDDDVPLSLVKEKQSIERKESIRTASQGSSAAPRAAPAPVVDLIGGDDSVPARASSTGPPVAKVAPKAEAAPPKATSTKDSLLGLDFLGGGSTAPPRPASTSNVSSPGAQSRPDLKQSILSLYASAPKPQAQPQHAQQGSFGGMGSPQFGNQQQFGHQQQGSMGGFNDAFSGLSMSNTTSPKPAAPDPFASFGSVSSSSRATPQTTSSNAFGGLSGGSFFDSKPAQPAQPTHQKQPSNSGFGDFGAFSSPSPPVAPAQSKPVQPASSAMGDLFDLSSPPPQTTTSPPPVQPTPPAASNSVFNLSAPQNKPAAPEPATNTTTSDSFGGWGGSDVFGGNEWASAAPPAPPQKSPEIPQPASNSMGWGAPASFANTPIVPGTGGGFNAAPKVSADEEFGGWSSSTAQPAGNKPAAKGGFGGDDDLFSNVWQ